MNGLIGSVVAATLTIALMVGSVIVTTSGSDLDIASTMSIVQR